MATSEPPSSPQSCALRIEAPAVHEAVAYLVDGLPPNAHLVISIRADPPLALSRQRARRCYRASPGGRGERIGAPVSAWRVKLLIASGRLAGSSGLAYQLPAAGLLHHFPDADRGAR
jgi:hypothetical protein